MKKYILILFLVLFCAALAIAARQDLYSFVTSPVLDDYVLGVDISNTAQDPAGSTANFRLRDLPVSTPTQTALSAKMNTSHPANSITDAGSGTVISATERTKLEGIAAGAQVNPPLATDLEITTGTLTEGRVVSPAQLKLSAETFGGSGTGDDLGNATAADIVSLFSGTSGYLTSDGTLDGDFADLDDLGVPSAITLDGTNTFDLVPLSTLGGTGASGYVSLPDPLYEDTPCTPGTYTHSADGLSKYECTTLGWRVIAMANSLPLMPVQPTYVSGLIGTGGLTSALTFSENVVVTGYAQDLTMTCASANGGSPFYLLNPSAVNEVVTFDHYDDALATNPVTVYQGDTCTVSFAGTVGSIVDTDLLDMAAFGPSAITNSSAEPEPVTPTCTSALTNTPVDTGTSVLLSSISNYQPVPNSLAGTACQADLYLSSADGTNVHVEIWDADGTAQIGPDSGTVAVSGSTPTKYTFTWAGTKPVLPAANFRLYVFKDDDGHTALIYMGADVLGDGMGNDFMANTSNQWSKDAFYDIYTEPEPSSTVWFEDFEDAVVWSGDSGTLTLNCDTILSVDGEYCDQDTAYYKNGLQGLSIYGAYTNYLKKQLPSAYSELTISEWVRVSNAFASNRLFYLRDSTDSILVTFTTGSKTSLSATFSGGGIVSIDLTSGEYDSTILDNGTWFYVQLRVKAATATGANDGVVEVGVSSGAITKTKTFTGVDTGDFITANPIEWVRITGPRTDDYFNSFDDITVTAP